jgi:hypothetical protein
MLSSSIFHNIVLNGNNVFNLGILYLIEIKQVIQQLERYMQRKLTDKVIILSNNIIGGMWKSKTKYCNKRIDTITSPRRNFSLNKGHT